MFAAEFLINKMAREYNETFMDVVTSLKEEIEFQDLIKSIEEKNIYKISAATKFEKFQPRQNLKNFSKNLANLSH